MDCGLASDEPASCVSSSVPWLVLFPHLSSFLQTKLKYYFLCEVQIPLFRSHLFLNSQHTLGDIIIFFLVLQLCTLHFSLSLKSQITDGKDKVMIMPGVS